jgi:hypothetical protein
LAVLASITLTGCYPGPVDPVGMPAVPAPYIRTPYMQNVSDSAAWVLWMSPSGSADTAWFRVPSRDTSWIGATIEPHLGRTRRARLSPLPAATVVEYRVSASGVRTGAHAFRTAPPQAPPAGEIRVLLFGDSGWGGPEQLDLARQMRRLEWDLAIHVGDIAYNDGTEREFTERHFQVYAPILASVPFYPAVGNHDVRADGGRSYDAAFLWPEPYPGARHYAFRWGAVLFISIDTASRSRDVDDLRSASGAQYEWLEATLREGAADSTVRWMIAFEHHPLYSHAIGVSGHGLDRALRSRLMPLFERYGVDLIAAGHDHHYERTWPVRDGRRVDPGCGPVHVLSGGGGASQYARDVQRSSLAAQVRRVYEFVELSIGSSVIRARTIDRAGIVIDEFTVRPFGGTHGGLPEGCAR